MNDADAGRESSEEGAPVGNSTGEYSVGYKKPPLHTRFQKGGRSPNPAGRPKGARSLKTDFLQEADTVLSVNDGGQRRKLSKQQIAINSLTTLAMKGNIRALAKFIDLSLRFRPSDEIDQSERSLSEADQEIIAAFLKRHSEEH